MNKLAFLGAGVVAVFAAIAALTYEHSVGAPLPNPPKDNKCAPTTPCHVPMSTTSIFGKCWVSAGATPLEVPKNTPVSWTLPPIGGDRVEFYDPNLVIKKDTAGDFSPPTIDSPRTTVTVTATGAASATQLEYVIYARRFKGSGPTDYENCWATNPFIVNVAQ